MVAIIITETTEVEDGARNLFLTIIKIPWINYILLFSYWLQIF
jgi:hypothetical protein